MAMARFMFAAEIWEGEEEEEEEEEE